MPLFNNVRNQLDDVLGQPNSANSKRFSQSLKKRQMDSFGGTAQPDTWNRIGEFIVPAQEQYRWGYGRAKNPENQGYMYVLLQNTTPSEVTGSFRIAQTNAQETNKLVVYEDDSETLHGSKSDRTQQKPLPEQVNKPKVGRDSKLILEFYPDSDGSVTVDSENSEIILPVTTYTL